MEKMCIRDRGVPYPGKYKEIFNSDAKKFGGSGVVNARVKASKKEECDERKHSIVINVAPLSVQIFSFTKNETKKTEKKAEEKTPKVSRVRKELEEKIEAERQQEEKKYEVKSPKLAKVLKEEKKPEKVKKEEVVKPKRTVRRKKQEK